MERYDQPKDKIGKDMSDKKMVFNGPLEVNMDVFVVNDETEQPGKVTIGLGVCE